MSYKLLHFFCFKNKIHGLLTIVCFLCFLVTCLYIGYMILTVSAGYQKWKPVYEKLDENWYYYLTDSPYFEPSAAQKYLEQNEDAVSLNEFREQNKLFIENNGFFYDPYSEGVIFEAETERVKEIESMFDIEGQIVPLFDIADKESDFLRVVGIPKIIMTFVLGIIADVFAVCWFSYSLKKGSEELKYLHWINSDMKSVGRLYCFIPFYAAAGLWLLSFGAVWIPNNHTRFWRIYYYIPLIMLGIIAVNAVIMVMLYRLVWNKKYRRLVEDFRTDEKEGRMYVDDLTLFDNLKLILLAQGFSESGADELLKQMLGEKQILFCARRPLAAVIGEERVSFYDLQDRLMKKD